MHAHIMARDYAAAIRIGEIMTQADVAPDYITLSNMLQLFRRLGYVDGTSRACARGAWERSGAAMPPTSRGGV